MSMKYLALQNKKWSLRGALATWQSQEIASLRPVHPAYRRQAFDAGLRSQ
jgi:hypothetical protein